MKEINIKIAIFVVILFLLFGSWIMIVGDIKLNEIKDECESKGGIYMVGRTNIICIKRESVINLTLG